MVPAKWTILLASISIVGVLHNGSPAEAQLLKLPRLRWPSFHRGNKKDSPVELKGSATNQDPSVTHVYAGGNGGPSSPPGPPPPLGPPLSASLPPSLGPPPPPPSLYGSGYSPFSPFGRPSPYGRPPNPFVFSNIVAPPPPPPPPPSSNYYSSSSSSSPGRKTRRRRPVYDNDSIEDASTEDEPVYIKVKPRKRRPIVIDEEELLGRAQNGGSSEEIDEREPKLSYKSRSKPQVVYVDSSREYQSPNERRMLIKNEEMVQDAPSYHSPTISALHASVSSGGYQLNSRLPPRGSDSVLFVNDMESSTGPTYHIDGHGDHPDFSGHFLLQNMRQVNQLRQGIQSNAKTFRIPESSTTTPTIRIVLNSMNTNPDPPQMPRQILPPATTPNPLQFSRAQIPPPQAPAAQQHNVAQSMNHFQIYEPTPSVFHQQGPPANKHQFHFGIGQSQPLGWPQAAPPTNFHHTPPPAPPPAPGPPHPKPDTVKVARRSFPGTFPLAANPSAGPTMSHDHRLFAFAHGDVGGGGQPSLIGSQAPMHVQGPGPVVRHMGHIAHPESAQTHHHVYARPPPHQSEEIYIEKPRKKISSFASTEIPSLSAAQAHKNQQYIDFSCTGRRSGYYANRMYKCQIYHQCSKRVLAQTFICPNGTAFNEKQKLCERVEKVACIAEESTSRGSRLRGSPPSLHQPLPMPPQPLPPSPPQQATEQPPQISSRADVPEPDTDIPGSTTPHGVSATADLPVSTPSTSHQPKYSTSVSYHVSSSSTASAS